MKTHQRLFLFVILLLLVGILVGQNTSFADPIESDTGIVLKMQPGVWGNYDENSPGDILSRESLLPLGSLEGHPRNGLKSNTNLQFPQIQAEPTLTNILTPTELQRHNISPSQDEVCWQLLGNSTMDIFPIDDSSATVEPWVPLVQQVYYYEDVYSSPPTSLSLQIDDDGDTDYVNMIVEDAFGQAFFMPDDLTSIYIEYNVSLLFANEFDSAYFEIWTVDSDGYLVDTVGIWQIDDLNPPEPPDWQQQWLFSEDPDFLNALEGQVLALIFDNFTSPDNLPPPGELGEVIWFDDAQIIACANVPESSGNAYMPLIVNNVTGSSDPICVPPTETPQDSFTQHRGTVQTGALCETTLSNVDRQDYYSFRTAAAGNYTLSLTDLPANTEWSGSILIENPPAYAPGPANNQCRITTPGAVNKQVTCNLGANKEYIVKVSAGDYNGATGSYRMRITKP